MTMNKNATKIEAEIRLRRALDHIQTAQTQVGRALGEVSSLTGCLKDWERLNRLYDRVHSEWYKLEARRQKGNFDLDGISAGP